MLLQNMKKVLSMTIYDIAAEAGVSASTVSRVLNNKMGVNLETRAKVERLLRKYNFEPNASAPGTGQQLIEDCGYHDVGHSHVSSCRRRLLY